MKFAYLHIRVTKETKDQIKKAAKAATKQRGRLVTMSAFIIEAALAAAQQALPSSSNTPSKDKVQQ